jgi:hypothetical protein
LKLGEEDEGGNGKLRRIKGRRSEDGGGGGGRRTQPLLGFDLASVTT